MTGAYEAAVAAVAIEVLDDLGQPEQALAAAAINALSAPAGARRARTDAGKDAPGDE